MGDYETMLETGLEKVPKVKVDFGRFEIPKVKGHIQGNKTVLSNFGKIADVLRRKPEQLLKYILKELAAPGNLRGSFVVFGSKVSASRINDKIQQFANEFVICKDCGKPDTKIKKEGSVSVLKCLACGARYSIKTKI